MNVNVNRGARRSARRLGIAVLLGAVAAAGSAGVGSPSVDWWSIDGGGELSSQGASWTLSGTVGQPDATPPEAMARGSWTLTGGFWAIESGDSDRLFSDGFESR